MGPENTYRSPTEGPLAPRSSCSSTSRGATTVKLVACSSAWPPPPPPPHPAAKHNDSATSKRVTNFGPVTTRIGIPSSFLPPLPYYLPYGGEHTWYLRLHATDAPNPFCSLFSGIPRAHFFGNLRTHESI